MKELLRKRIKELTSLIGVSGDEWDVAEYIYHALDGFVDELEVRDNGQVIAIKKGTMEGPRVLVTAHMDEVGYRIKGIDENGFAYFDAIGSATQACLPGRKVIVRGKKGTITGVVGVRAAHLLTEEQKKQPQTAAQSYIDLFVSTKQEALDLGIYMGASVVPDSPCTEVPHNPDYMITRAADCRLLCAVIIETIKKLKPEEIHGEVCAVFNILEETTIRAISSAVTYLKPKYGFFLDTVPCGDVPDVNTMELPIALKKGPTLITSMSIASAFMNVVAHPKLVEAAKNTAEKNGISYQEFAFNGATYGTDAIGAIYAGEGMATLTIACPRRFSHSPVEIFHMEDVVGTQKLVESLLKQNIDLKMFKKKLFQK